MPPRQLRGLRRCVTGFANAPCYVSRTAVRLYDAPLRAFHPPHANSLVKYGFDECSVDAETNHQAAPSSCFGSRRRNVHRTLSPRSSHAKKKQSATVLMQHGGGLMTYSIVLSSNSSKKQFKSSRSIISRLRSYLSTSSLLTFLKSANLSLSAFSPSTLTNTTKPPVLQ